MPSMIIFMPKPLTTICLKTKSRPSVRRPITYMVARSEINSEQEEPQDGQHLKDSLYALGKEFELHRTRNPFCVKFSLCCQV
jgi:hypothetical protein